MIQTAAISFSVSVCAIGVLKPLALRAGFVDTPGVRKRHEGVIPLIGGLAIYLTLLALCLVFPFWREQNGAWLIALGLPLLLTGMADDKWNLSASRRLLLEIFCCLFAVIYCGIRLDDLGHLLPNVGGTLVLLAIPLSVVGMVGVINSLNMTDGVDGLAGGLSALTFAALAWLTFPDKFAVSLQLMSFVAALLGFLVFNSRFFGRKRACIFMGDGGALFIGFAIAWYLIMLSQGPEAVITPVSALWLFAVPLVDTMTIMARRIARGQSPYAADREHLHHIVMLAGFGTNRTVLIILSSHLLFILYGVASIRFKVPEWVSFTLFIAMLATYGSVMSHAWKVMKKIKSFREWAGFEDRRIEISAASGSRARRDRRVLQVEFSGPERRTGKDRRSGKER